MRLSWIPNAICIVRIVLIVPLVASLAAGDFVFALTLILVAGISDGVDGFLARTFGWRSRLGSVLDPAADKLLVVSSFVTLSVLTLVPIGLTAVVILRDLVIVSGALAYSKVAGRLVGEPTLISKLNTAGQLLFLVCVITRAEWGRPPNDWLVPLGAVVVFTSIVSGLNYVLIWSQRARQARAA